MFLYAIRVIILALFTLLARVYSERIIIARAFYANVNKKVNENIKVKVKTW